MKRATVMAGAILLTAAWASTNVLGARAAPATDGEQNFFFLNGEGSWLGVAVQDVTAEKVRSLKLPGDYGTLVMTVEAGSPAARAGVKPGDVILELAGERVRSITELERLVRETPPGRNVTLRVSRAGKTLTLAAQIARRSSEEFRPRIEIPPVHIPDFNFNFGFPGRTRLGILGDDLTPQLADYFGVKQGKGVLVTEVTSGSAAQKAGLKAGDVIVQAGDEEVDSVAILRRSLSGDPNQKRQVVLTIVRGRKEQKVTVELEPVAAPERVAELRNPGISPQEMDRLRTETQAQAAEVAKSARELSQQIGKVKEEVQRAMQEREKEMELLKRELLRLRLQRLRQPI